MLLKCTADGSPIKVNEVPVNHGIGARGMKMTMSTAPTMSARVHRKVMRAPHKRPHPGKTAISGKMVHAGKMVHHAGKHTHLGKFGKLSHYVGTHSLLPPEPCENSNDSGLGQDAAHRLSDTLEDWEYSETKRRQCGSEMAFKLECEDANDAYAYSPVTAPAQLDAPPHALAPPPLIPVPVITAGCSISSQHPSETGYRSCGKLGGGGKLGKYSSGGKLSSGKLGGKLAGKYGGKLVQAMARRRAMAAMAHGPPGLAAPLMARSRDGTVELQILCQPESQHRARYQTEGSRGAVKDNSGNGFPVVKLVGYDKPAVLQVFIGTDTGRVAPHMFYQACRVSGKNSTPCRERKEDGTVIIEIDLEPAKSWQVTCDCVGILKERNVDVEHRFGEALSSGAGGGGGGHVSRGKKKSTRCRMVFRTDILSAGQPETLQVCSTQIICTQPPGVPEVCRKSLVSCPASGGLELYLLGKNFLKETRVVFSQRHEGRTTWEEEVIPDKEFLQQTHLVCCVPPFARELAEPVAVQLFVRSGGKASEPHAFYYTPAGDAGPLHCTRHAQGDERPIPWGGGLMPPPMPVRRPSIIVPDPNSPMGLKSEVTDDTSQHSVAEHADSCDGPPCEPALPDELKVVDLRLKPEAVSPQVGYVSGYETMKLSPVQSDTPVSPLETFTQQLQAMQNQVQTDKMVETVTAAIFNSDDNSAQIYQPILPMQTMDPMSQLISSKSNMETEMKVMNPELMLQDRMQTSNMFNQLQPRPEDEYNPFGSIAKMEMESSHLEHRLAQQSAHMTALVEDAMKATAAMLPADAAKLDELVNARVDDHLSGASTSPPGGAQVSPPRDELMLLPDQVPLTSVKTPPSAVKSMILNAAAEILTSDSTMNALVTSALNTANILSTDAGGDVTPASGALPEDGGEPMAAMSQAVSAAVTQAVSQAVSHAVSHAVSQEMTAPVRRLTDMSDQDLLSYINPSTFDQV